MVVARRAVRSHDEMDADAKVCVDSGFEVGWCYPEPGVWLTHLRVCVWGGGGEERRRPRLHHAMPPRGPRGWVGVLWGSARRELSRGWMRPWRVLPTRSRFYPAQQITMPVRAPPVSGGACLSTPKAPV
jgi:hypothetical protein